MEPTSFLTAAAQLLLALLLAGILGWEREIHARSAGLRTYMLVGLGSCTFAMVTRSAYGELLVAGQTTGMDPLRVVESVAGGLGFLGAGCIIQARGSVIGLTTAAGIWVVGSIGVACALGLHGLAVTATLLALFVLRGIAALERVALRRHRPSPEGVAPEGEGRRAGRPADAREPVPSALTND